MTRLPLALVLLLPLCARADDFSSALGDIQAKAALRMAQIRVVPKRPAQGPQANLPAASETEWAKVIEAVKKSGKFNAGNLFQPASFMLEDKTGDPKADHMLRVVSFLGELNDQGKFEAAGALIIWMDYKLDAATGNFNAEQWMFETDVYGQLKDVGHMTAVMGPNGRPVAPPVPEKLLPGDARVKAKLDEQVSFWAGK
ncbi:MAG: hypothetical protein M0D55_02440 [Elusimicrobiota bacterium]|nr:MAG: hypothetical protein M0D55_02440 [Elusimicrobiota bacterium]